MLVLDTAVLVYAVGSDHALREPCQALLDAVGRGELEATTTIEVIQEFAHVRARRRGRADAVTLARAYVDLLAPLAVVEQADLIEGLRLFEHHERLGAFDCVLAAAALALGADALVSPDRGYAAVSGIRHVVPDKDGVGGLLSGKTTGRGRAPRD